jgi:hypothetical protein
MDNRIMTEELNNSDTQGDKNWKEMREKLNLYEAKIAEYEGKERQEVFKQAGLDTTKGVGKAVEMMYEGDLTVEGIQEYASQEFSVEFGNQDRLQDNVEQSQEKLNNIQKNSVVDLYNTDAISQVKDIEKSGNVRNSIAAKLSVIEEAKKNS